MSHFAQGSNLPGRQGRGLGDGNPHLTPECPELSELSSGAPHPGPLLLEGVGRQGQKQRPDEARGRDPGPTWPGLSVALLLFPGTSGTVQDHGLAGTSAHLAWDSLLTLAVSKRPGKRSSTPAPRRPRFDCFNQGAPRPGPSSPTLLSRAGCFPFKGQPRDSRVTPTCRKAAREAPGYQPFL